MDEMRIKVNRSIITRTLLVFIFLGIQACGESNLGSVKKDTQDFPSDPEIPFPHPDGFGEASEHGTLGLGENSTLLAKERCVPCHDLQGEKSSEGIPGCKACHSNYPHPKAFGESAIHVDSVYGGVGKLTDVLEASCGTDCHGSDLAGGLSGVSCNRCHKTYPHKLLWAEERDHGMEFFLDASEAKRGCASCHGSDLRGGDYAPSCLKCHDLPLGQAAIQHKPLKSGNCDACHLPDGELALAVPTLCHNCHEEGKEEALYRHSPVTEGDTCTNCHDPHESDFGGLLQKSPEQTCFDCHDHEIASVQYGTTENMLALFMNANSSHSAFTDGKCQDCHEIHGASKNHLIKFEGVGNICYNCHDSATYAETGSYTIDPGEGYQSEQLPTHFVSGNLGTGLYLNMHRKHVGLYHLSCSNCHDSHASGSDHLIIPGENYSAPTSLTGYRSGSCTGCHSTLYP